MELSWVNDFLTLLERAFRPEVISKGMQRGFLFAGAALAYIAVTMVLLRERKPNSWLYYRILTGKRVAASAQLADEVGALEGEVAGLERRLALLLRELEIRNGQPSASIASASPAPVPTLPVPSALPPLPQAAPSLPPLPPLPPAAAPA